MMELYEVVEVCPHCEAENTIKWDTETMGYVAKCEDCGEKMMLCNECMYVYNSETDRYEYIGYCDWCDEAGGVCFRDTSPVLLTTYGHYEEKGDAQYVVNFEVPKNWLWKYVKKNGYATLDEFLDTFTWDATMHTYARALEDKVIINEWEE